jgi:small redox-active disulfide protein 2
MKLEVLGTGCPKCRKVYENAEQAVKELGTCVEISKVEDLKAIMSFGIMTTPALAVNGEVKVSGKIPSVAEIKSIISESSEG